MAQHTLPTAFQVLVGIASQLLDASQRWFCFFHSFPVGVGCVMKALNRHAEGSFANHHVPNWIN